METVEEFFSRSVRSWRADPSDGGAPPGDPAVLQRLFDAQLQSRHLDYAARWLQSQGRGHYTIGSAGHESNAALGLLTRVDDPALLHYRSGGFYAARAAQAGTTDPIRDVLLSLTSSARDPMSGGRHKVWGHPDLHIIPQTSTISSHLPRAVGLAYALGLARSVGHTTPWPDDAIVVCSFGDASANHSTAVGAINAASYLTQRGVPCPILFVCEDNRIGVSTPSPDGWPGAMLQSIPGIEYVHIDGADPIALLDRTAAAVARVRDARRPVVLHLDTVRFLGHAGSDTEIAYRTQSEIVGDYERDPLLATARCLMDADHATPEEILAAYEGMRTWVMDAARTALDEPHLSDRAQVMAPLALPTVSPRIPTPEAPEGEQDGARLTLAQSINQTLAELLATHPEVLVFGEDVAVKGGVYGVTRGLRKRFGAQRVFDTLLDEQTILGVALGSALAGFVPVPEIQYLAYLHNAEDQLRGEAASLRFFSNGQYQNGMVVRVAGLAYQRGFGGHFHNDNSVAVLRDIPGLVLAVPSHPADAPGLLRTCVELARQDGRVCVFLEPIALYHARDLGEGDGAWTAPFANATSEDSSRPLGEVGVYGDGGDLLLVTFGNGVPMSLRASEQLREHGIATTVVDLRWLSPLPLDALRTVAERFPAVLVVDETRASGGVSEGVVTGLLERGYRGRLSRVASADTFIPLGPAAATVLLSEEDVVAAALSGR
ncbi:thiamine pyrophosphate-dependent enzyme [Nocardioides sp. WS12]|uniref:thiamine pyrophosphate-dependent enzyme n=1 Tax=Nocardioides sp. WS12 TaxID=2486272 RepID=UPI0015F86440|nr:thiamine pyrophosphate-dependent enzyme [Nocardioides sp. WS12]